ncbi:hypothetical protein GobsT_40880 [Gemmata obscuriglobus]|uniref:hypothetical protein n=1 Tax=Gemmata obscuriglobus TaxID=114 RepID=UPI00016C402E|nr:hypothetical protein [Gemmata obscuriglobus]QEG29293.1 hypothetical protein GobsT_40880 [Gemmata obscuriglobus]VTS08257.1 Uncharacterized protein OS=Pirellula staleyi (strain ATCC 27377 / DSM 6068 / ICPB 4128) GN=Psta_2333 PE=4 SV=1 [Gemmata obscuriglobus UQM 2246]
MRWTPLVALCITLSVASAAPVPKHLMKEEPFWPTAVGTKWVYDVEGKEERYVISKVRDDPEGQLVSVDQVVGGKNVPYEEVLVSATRLTRVGWSGKECEKPELLLRAPVEKGDYWSPNYTSSKPRREVVEVKGVEVQAGVFQAVRIECSFRGGMLGPPPIYHEWYARGVGLVKRVSGNGEVKVLKSFTPGKK